MIDSKPTVLIVEDSDDCSETLELALLSLKDVRIAIVRSAEEALEHFSIGSLAALVTDLHLPHMDGLHLLSAIRMQPSGRRLPVVVISGDCDPRTPSRVMAAGAQAFFSKPYSPAAVRRKLEELLAASGRNGNGSHN
jgi:two-component system chemotaxis response regulator CheY